MTPRRAWWPFTAGLVVGATAIVTACLVADRRPKRKTQLRLVQQTVEGDVSADEFDQMWNEASPVTIEGDLTIERTSTSDESLVDKYAPIVDAPEWVKAREDRDVIHDGKWAL